MKLVLGPISSFFSSYTAGRALDKTISQLLPTQTQAQSRPVRWNSLMDGSEKSPEGKSCTPLRFGARQPLYRSYLCSAEQRLLACDPARRICPQALASLGSIQAGLALEMMKRPLTGEEKHCG